MRSCAPYLASLLVLLMTPGVGEVVENIVHVVETGHGAHALSDAAHDFGDGEHGCSGPFHVCVCHTSTLFSVGMAAAQLSRIVRTAPQILPAVDAAERDGFELGVFRPPIA